MMTTHLRFSLLLAFFCLISVAVSASALSNGLLGLAPQDVGYYEYEVIKCKDGYREFKKEQLNDDFCDCPDGTDEPGTSACPDGKFYCQNVGHSPLTLFSSRVNDGICVTGLWMSALGVVGLALNLRAYGFVSRKSVQRKILNLRNFFYS